MKSSQMGPHAATTSNTLRVHTFSGTCLGQIYTCLSPITVPAKLQQLIPVNQEAGWQVVTSLSLTPSKGESPHLLSGPQSPSATRPKLLATLQGSTVFCLLTYKGNLCNSGNDSLSVSDAGKLLSCDSFILPSSGAFFFKQKPLMLMKWRSIIFILMVCFIGGF